MAESRTHAFRRFEILKDLSEKALEDLARSCSWSSAPAGNQILQASQLSSEVYFVISGKVRVLLYSAAEGRQVLFTVLGPHEIFGELAAIDGSPRSATVEAEEACQLAILQKEQFHRLMRVHPDFAFAIMKHLVAHVRRLSDHIHELSVLSVESRVHAELLRLACLKGEKNGHVLLSPAPRRADLAARIAATRFAVSRVITNLEAEGIIRRESISDIRILDIERLRKYVLEAKGE